jgi:hypothetical protein
VRRRKPEDESEEEVPSGSENGSDLDNSLNGSFYADSDEN